MATEQDAQRVQQEFQRCQKVLTAMGDEVRQKILLLMVLEKEEGCRVVDIAEKTNLTRPAVSHHMQILKDAKIVRCRKEGRYVYYEFNHGANILGDLLELFADVRHVLGFDEIRRQEEEGTI